MLPCWWRSLTCTGLEDSWVTLSCVNLLVKRQLSDLVLCCSAGQDSWVTLSFVVLLVKRQFCDLVLCCHAGKDHRHAAAWDPSITARHAGPGKERRVSATFWSCASPHATRHVASSAFVTIAMAQLWEINLFFCPQNLLNLSDCQPWLCTEAVMDMWFFILFFIDRLFVHVAESLTFQLCFSPQWPWEQQKWHWLKPFLLKCSKFLPLFLLLFCFHFSLQNFKIRKVKFLA